jgi:hypothetical protein
MGPAHLVDCPAGRAAPVEGYLPVVSHGARHAPAVLGDEGVLRLRFRRGPPALDARSFGHGFNMPWSQAVWRGRSRDGARAPEGISTRRGSRCPPTVNDRQDATGRNLARGTRRLTRAESGAGRGVGVEHGDRLARPRSDPRRVATAAGVPRSERRGGPSTGVPLLADARVRVVAAVGTVHVDPRQPCVRSRAAAAPAGACRCHYWHCRRCFRSCSPRLLRAHLATSGGGGIRRHRGGADAVAWSAPSSPPTRPGRERGRQRQARPKRSSAAPEGRA